MHWFDVEFLWDHNPPHDGVHEEREKDIPQKYEHSHHHSDDGLLGGVQGSSVATHQPAVHTHGGS